MKKKYEKFYEEFSVSCNNAADADGIIDGPVCMVKDIRLKYFV